MFSLFGGLYLGWALGANDAANAFGTAVASRIISFKRACVLCALAVIVGATLQGAGGIQTLSALANQTQSTLLVVAISAAITVTIMTILRLPISASQAMVGSIVGVGLATGHVNWTGVGKVVLCWLATPVGAMAISCGLYLLIDLIIRRVPMSMLTRDKILWSGLVLVGTYASYALGANNVANATGIFSGQVGLTDQELGFLGGAAIALGVMTYSRRVMMTVGSGVMRLEAFTALVAVSSMALTVHTFALIGVPVSTSHAIIGAIMGIGLMRGAHLVRFRVLRNIAYGWLLTPVVSLILAAAGYALFGRSASMLGSFLP
jgi:PiT family inorganic phosphate transporter